MPRITMGFGAVLMLVGVVGYIATGLASATALLPAVPGVILGVLGWIAQNESHRKQAMHWAAALGALCFLLMVVGMFMTIRGGAWEARPLVVVVQALTAVLLAVFVGLCVKSFVDARRGREAPAPPEG